MYFDIILKVMYISKRVSEFLSQRLYMESVCTFSHNVFGIYQYEHELVLERIFMIAPGSSFHVIWYFDSMSKSHMAGQVMSNKNTK